MRHILPVILLSFGALASVSAAADEKEMIYREDSGLTKAEYFLAKGKYSAALDAAADVLKRHPNNADALTYRGYAEWQLGQTSQARKSFKAALSVNPTHLGANKYLADLYLQSGDVARAREQMQVIRMVCGGSDCAELDALESAIDNFRHSLAASQKEAKGKDAAPATKKEDE